MAQLTNAMTKQVIGRQQRPDDAVYDAGHGPSEVLSRGYPGGGQKVAAGDFVLGAGLGSTASVAVAAASDGSAACDTRGTITVTCSGTGQSQATSTITVTFKEPFAAAPFVFVNRVVAGAGTGAATIQPRVVSVSTTGFVVNLTAAPVANDTYIIEYVVLER